MSTQKTFKDLNTKKKIEHIWEYYKGHIIGTIIAVIIIISIITTVTRPKPPIYPVNMIVTGKMVVDEVAMEPSLQKLRETMGADLYFMPCDWSTISQSTMVNDQTLMVKFQVGEGDVVAAAEDRHEKFLNIQDFDAFAMLDEMPEFDALLEQYKDQLVTGISKEDGKEHVFGIRISELNGVEGVRLAEDVILSIITQPKDRDAAIKLVTYMLQ